MTTPSFVARGSVSLGGIVSLGFSWPKALGASRPPTNSQTASTSWAGSWPRAGKRQERRDGRGGATIISFLGGWVLLSLASRRFDTSRPERLQGSRREPNVLFHRKSLSGKRQKRPPLRCTSAVAAASCKTEFLQAMQLWVTMTLAPAGREANSLQEAPHTAATPARSRSGSASRRTRGSRAAHDLSPSATRDPKTARKAPRFPRGGAYL